MTSRALGVQDITFPPHVLLRSIDDRGNWTRYKRAVEIVCQMHSVESHLVASTSSQAHGRNAEEQLRWAREDALCKAIIVLNVDESVELESITGGQSAAAIWAAMEASSSECRIM